MSDWNATCEKVGAGKMPPARNCDVGTAEDMAKRFTAFCVSFDDCDKCPLFGVRAGTCDFSWMLMPYEEHAPCKHRKHETRNGVEMDWCYAIGCEEPGDMPCEYCADEKAKEGAGDV